MSHTPMRRCELCRRVKPSTELRKVHDAMRRDLQTRFAVVCQEHIAKLKRTNNAR